MKSPTNIRLAFLILVSYICLASFSQDTLSYNPYKIRVKFSPSTKHIVKQQIAALQNQNIKQQSIGILAVDYLNQIHGAEKMRQLFKTNQKKHQQLHERYELDAWFEITLTKKITPHIIEAYNRNSQIIIAEPVYKKRLIDGFSDAAPQLISDDPDFSDQWHYENNGQTGGTIDADIDLQAAWDIETGDSNVVVAIIDGGIDISHEDLWNAMWINETEYYGVTGIDDDGNGYIDDKHGYNFGDNTGGITADDHGTHVAGTVGAINNNGTGVSGVAGGSGDANGVRLMSCQTFGEFDNDGFAEALVYAADNGAVIAQNSWGYESPGVYEQAVLDAIDYFIANAGTDGNGNQTGPMDGGIVIFAAGNDNEDNEWYPGYYNSVLSVASTNHNDQRAYYSNFGTWVDIAAPGGETYYDEEGVLSTLPSNSYGYLQGTSMACPHVSGVAALVVSQFQGNGFEAQDVWDRLVNTSDYIDDINPMYVGRMGSGRLNAFNALQEDDGIPPAAINDLAIIDQNTTGLVLEWTSTGSSGNSGTASYYDMRYSSSPINGSNFEDAQEVYGEPQPNPSGSTQQFEITGLSPSTNYYLAIKVVDGFGNISDISNIASGRTSEAPQIHISPEQLSVSLGEGTSTTATISISNAGNAMLDFSFSDNQETANTNTNNTSILQFNKPVTKQSDERKGHPVQNGKGSDGPGGFGYRWIDNLEINGPTYDWIDIDNSGMSLNLGDDDYIEESLPFSFPFYGNNQSYVYISSNGFVSFSESAANMYNNQQLPNSEIPNNVIAAFWDDLNPADGGQIYYEEFTDKCIIQYNNIPSYGNSSDIYTFQIILYPSGNIKLQYQLIDGDNSSCTVGLENSDGSEGMSILFNTDYLVDNHAIFISSQELISSIAPVSGNINPGESKDVTITFDASELGSGSYFDELFISSNDPLKSTITVPIDLSVIDCDPDTTFLVESICEGEKINIGDSEFSENGEYHIILENQIGCDSIVVLDLTVNPTNEVHLSEEICEGQSYKVGNEVFDESGSYTVYLNNMNGCDSVVYLDLQVHPEHQSPISAEICEGGSYQVGEEVFTEEGEYEVYLTNQYGCDSVVRLNLNVNRIDEVYLNESICEGQSYQVGNKTFNETGEYSVTLTNQHGCDSVVHLDLTVNATHETELIQQICEGESFTVGEQTYTESGNYTVELTNQYGCDSVINLDLTVIGNDETHLTPTICEGQNYRVGDEVFTESGNYTIQLTNKNGCDSVVYLDLTVHETDEVNFSAKICEGESYEIGAETFTQTGQYSVVLKNQNDCDSIVNLHLVVHDGNEVYLTKSICEGGSYQIGAEQFYESGDYTVYLENRHGCDSVVHLNLTVHPQNEISIDTTICQGESVAMGGNTYTTSGDYEVVLTNQHGCDSIINLDLTINPIHETHLTKQICAGESYSIGDEVFTESGNYTIILTNRHGCDSLINIQLQVNEPNEIYLQKTICPGTSVEIGGNSYSESGNYVITLTNQNGCDSIVNLALTKLEANETNLDEEICVGENYWVGDQVFSESGSYSVILQNQQGCDSIVNLNLTVLSNGMDEVNIQKSICEGDIVQIGEETFNESGEYQIMLTNEHGCDSVIYLNLQVKDTSKTFVFDTVCPGDTIYRGDDTLFAPGEYTITRINENGCEDTTYFRLSNYDVNEIFISVDTSLTGTIFLDAGHGFVSYDWNTGAHTQTIEVDESVGAGIHTYIVHGMDVNGCTTSDTISIILNNPTGVDFTGISKIVSVFPNPTSEKLYFQINWKASQILVQFINLNGIIVQENEINLSHSNNQFDINVSDIIDGIYIVKIISNEFIYTKRVMIQNRNR